MRHFLLLLFLIPSLSNAQKNYGASSIPDSTSSNRFTFVFLLNGGISIPESDYKSPPLYTYNSSPNPNVSGFSLNGVHMDFTELFFPSSSTNAGLAAKFGTDINNPGNIVTQYLVGLCLPVKPIKSKFNIYFLTLIGLVTANITNSNNSFGNYQLGYGGTWGNEVPGFGNGVGLYGGVGLSFKVYKRFYCNFSGGVLLSGIDFPNGITTTYSSQPSNTFPYSFINSTSVSTSHLTMNIEILQANLGISYQF